MSINFDHQNNKINSDNNVITIDSTGALVLPTSNISNRPLLTNDGMTRMIKDPSIALGTGKLEFYNGTKWQIVVSNDTGALDDLIPTIIAQQSL